VIPSVLSAKSGGFLSSLFGRSSGAVSAAQGAVGAGSGGSTIGSFVSNTQKEKDFLQ